MSHPHLIIMRGLPGSGKSTWIHEHYPEAKRLHEDPTGSSPVVVSADHYFERPDGYYFRVAGLPRAHASCTANMLKALGQGRTVIVDNTHTTKWEFEVALAAAEAFNASLTIQNMYDGGCDNHTLAQRNTHGVPLDAIRRMRQRWED